MWKQTLIAALLSPSAQAALVPYDLVLHVQKVIYGRDLCIPAQRESQHRFGCEDLSGDAFVGHFSVDDSLLTKDGDNLSAPIFGFVLKVGTVVWDQDHASDFLGFRQYDGVFSAAPSFSVHDGNITALRGGVFGNGDSSFVDFFGSAFTANDEIDASLSGTLGIAPAAVPEPGMLALLVGCSIAGWAGRRKV